MFSSAHLYYFQEVRSVKRSYKNIICTQTSNMFYIFTHIEAHYTLPLLVENNVRYNIFKLECLILVRFLTQFFCCKIAYDHEYNFQGRLFEKKKFSNINLIIFFYYKKIRYRTHIKTSTDKNPNIN